MKLKESDLENILDSITKIDLTDFTIVGGLISDLKEGEIEHSPEILRNAEALIAETKKFSKTEKGKKKLILTMKLELQEK